LENIGDQDYIINVSRNILETINDNWFNCFTNLLLEISNNQDIDKVVLVGGTTRTPKITQIIDKYLSKKIDTTELNPDYTVSIGAAYQGYLLNTNINTNIDVTIVDTISMSLGIKTVGDIMTPIISKNTMIPCSHTETFVTTDSKQTIDIEVYQGERRFVKDNLKLGTFYINRSKIERETIQITFDITSDSILIVTARNMDNNTEMSVTFDNYLTKLESVVNLYTYSDDTDKMDDMELSNLILAKIELSNTVKSRRSITESHNASWKSDDPIKYNQYTDLLQRAEDIIDTYKNYTAEYLTEYKATFEKIWNEINFL
jgi:molecular chaperone DnaK (HSP70)